MALIFGWIHPEKALPAIIDATSRVGCRLDGVEYHRPRLDDVFIAYTGHSIQEESPPTP